VKEIRFILLREDNKCTRRDFACNVPLRKAIHSDGAGRDVASYVSKEGFLRIFET